MASLFLNFSLRHIFAEESGKFVLKNFLHPRLILR